MAGPAITARLGLDAGDFKKGLTDATKSVTNLRQSVESIAGAVGIGLGAMELVEFGKGALMAAAKVETLQTSFEVMLGSADNAKTLLADVMNFAGATPFQTDELAGATKSLLAFGSGSTEIVETLRRLGDIASGVDAPIGELAVLFGKARVSGRLMSEDVNQFTERGIPLIQELAKQFGVAESEVRKLVEKGQVGFGNLEEAIISLTSEGGKFFGMTAKQADTVAGKLSTMEDAWISFQRSLADTNAAKGGIDAITKAIEGMGIVAETLLGDGTNASLFGNTRKKGLAERIFSFATPKTGGSVQRDIEFEEYKKRQLEFNKQQADDEKKKAGDATKARLKDEAAARMKGFEMWQERELKRVDEIRKAEEKAEKEAEKAREDANEQAIEDAHRERDERIKAIKEEERERIDSNERIADAQTKAEEDAKQRQQDAEDAFVDAELAGPDARREARRQEAREKKARGKFKRLGDLDKRGGRAKQDVDDDMNPNNFRPRGKQVVDGITEADKDGKVGLTDEAIGALQGLLAAIGFVNIAGGGKK